MNLQVCLISFYFCKSKKSIRMKTSSSSESAPSSSVVNKHQYRGWRLTPNQSRAADGLACLSGGSLPVGARLPRRRWAWVLNYSLTKETKTNRWRGYYYQTGRAERVAKVMEERTFHLGDRKIGAGCFSWVLADSLDIVFNSLTSPWIHSF